MVRLQATCALSSDRKKTPVSQAQHSAEGEIEMSHNRCHAAFLKLALVTSSALSFPALAQDSGGALPQDASAGDDTSDQGEAIVVTGFRASLASALRAKRDDTG